MTGKLKFNVNVTNKELETKGTWVEWPLIEGVSVKLARLSSKPVQDHFRKLVMKNKKATRNETAMKKVMIQLFADKVILDWTGILADGEPFPFNPENAVKLLSDADDFYNWVEQECQSIINFMEDDVDMEETAEQLKK